MPERVKKIEDQLEAMSKNIEAIIAALRRITGVLREIWHMEARAVV